MRGEFLLIVQLTLGTTFLLSTVSKLFKPNGFAHGVAEYKIVPAYLSYPIAAVIVVIEGWLAIAHLTGISLPDALPAGIGLLAVFAVVVATNLGRGRLLPCYCFGESGGETISYLTLIRLLCLSAGELLLLSCRNSLASNQLKDHYQLRGLLGLEPELLGTMLLLLGVMWLLEVANLFHLLRSRVNASGSEDLSE